MEIQLPNYEIKVEAVDGRIDELMTPLFEEHWEESAKNKQLMVLNPDTDKYKLLESIGSLVTLMAYCDGELVGYSCNILSKHLHYRELLVAYNDVIFIQKNHRNTSLGLRIIKQTEIECKKRGARLMLWHAKEGTALSKILPKTRCKVQEIIYSKEL